MTAPLEPVTVSQNPPSVHRRGNRTKATDCFDSGETVNGLRLVQVGEDGDVLVLGHHDDDARLISAFRAYMASYDPDQAEQNVTCRPRWALFTTAEWSDEFDWWVHYAATERKPGRTAVTVVGP